MAKFLVSNPKYDYAHPNEEFEPIIVTARKYTYKTGDEELFYVSEKNKYDITWIILRKSKDFGEYCNYSCGKEAKFDKGQLNIRKLE